MSPVDRALQLKTELDSLRPLAPDVECKVLDKLRLDWNYHSNHLEGNQLDYGETKALLLHGITANSKPLRDHLEIRGHNEAVLQLLDMARNDAPISQTDIRNLHKMILGEPYKVNAETPEGLPSKKQVIPGEYKTQPNHVRTATGEMFHFAEPFDVPSRMTALMDWLEKQRGGASNPILIAATFHYDFVRIHPFDDGNGRMARLLMNLELMRAGFPPAVVRTEEKDAYLNALRQADGGDLTAFAEHIAERVERSLATMLAAARGEAIDEPNDLDKKLFLLEQTLRADDKLRETRKSLNSLHQIFDHLFVPCAQHLVDAMTKFVRFFDIHNKYVFVNQNQSGTYGDFAEQLAEARKGIDENCQSFRIGFSLRDSKVIGVTELHAEVAFNFRSNDFTVSVNFSHGNLSEEEGGNFTYDNLPEPVDLQRVARKIPEALLASLESAAVRNSISK